MEWFMQNLPSICWAAALVILVVAEAVTVGLTSIWFALGAFCALIVSIFTDNLLVQFIVFLVVSCITLLVLRPTARRLMSSKHEATNADRVIGAEAVVTEEIDNLKAQGAVRVMGVTWTARADGDYSIPAGAKVKVLRIEGVKLFVTPAACAARAE